MAKDRINNSICEGIWTEAKFDLTVAIDAMLKQINEIYSVMKQAEKDDSDA